MRKRIRIVVIISCQLSCLLVPFTGIGQDLVHVQGTQLTVQPGVELYIQGGITLNNSGGTAAVLNDGDITVASDPAAGTEDWTNNSAPGVLTGTGTVSLAADGDQTVSGTSATTFYDLVLGGVGTNTKHLVGVNATVSNVLALTDEVFNINGNNLTVTNASTNAITRTGVTAGMYTTNTNRGMVMSSGNGMLIRHTNSTGAYAFPVGSTTGTARFRPVDITPNSGAANQFGVAFVNHNASLDGLDIFDAEVTLQNLNPDWYHKITRVAGMANAHIGICFDQQTDAGNFMRIAQYTNNDPGLTPGWWEDINDTPGDMSYSFNAPGNLSDVVRSAYQYGYNTENFILEFGASPLPVELVAFDAEGAADHIDVSWHTSSENNNAGFELWRGESPTAMENIAWIEGTGTTSFGTTYTYDDFTAQPNVEYYYRLRQVDHNGQAEWSGVVSAAWLNAVDAFNWTIYPNPAKDEVFLQFSGREQRTGQLLLTNALGEVVWSQPLQDGIFNYRCNVSRFAAGVYHMTVLTKSGKETRKLVVR